MEAKRENERQREEEHFLKCMETIQQNIVEYEKKTEDYKKETEELFRAVQRGEVELYNQLITSQNLLEHMENTLRKNRAAQKKAYFGRIDYEEMGSGARESWYIGKNGIMKNRTDVVIVDWRAPVSSVYYENEMGRGRYEVPENNPVEIDLQRKRTYDVSEGKLLGYYDNDVASNDELLVKYLAQNKEAVLGDIIATIQKEQNEIIRDVPFKNVIVQGVAGSGKTTVAMHRISYILYNYERRFKATEFCIVGSNDMLLSYITSGLPELDVNHVRQLRMDQFLVYLMGRAFKKTYRVVPVNADGGRKSKLFFFRQLERFLEEKRQEALYYTDIWDESLGMIFTRTAMQEIWEAFPEKSLAELLAMMNDRVKKRIQFLGDEEDRERMKAKQAEYKAYFALPSAWTSELPLYLEFLESCEGMEESKVQAKAGRLDVYDVAALLFIWKRIFVKKQLDEFSQIIIDEAQDFGEMVYCVLHQVLPNCYFTIMGDVSQNIHYETGMNDWEDLKEAIFVPDRDSFCLLAPRYRNTIEISEFAARVLEKASAGKYRICPVIRHGKEVECIQREKEELLSTLQTLTEEILARGFETIAVVCRNEEEAKEVKESLKQSKKEKDKIKMQEYNSYRKEEQDPKRNKKQKGKASETPQEEEFHKGVMVLPIELIKGLEFDAVILWKPDEEHYGNNPKEAKLLYVAITRALHELYLLGEKKMTSLIS